MLVDVVLAVGNGQAAGCSMANMADNSKKMVVGEGVAMEAGSDSKVVGSKIVQSL